MPNNNDLISMFSDALARMIDSQVENTKVVSEFSTNLKQYNTQQIEIKDAINKINGHFSNGFRSEIKDHISECVNELRQEMVNTNKLLLDHNKGMEEVVAKVNNGVDTITSKAFWLKVFGTFIIAMASVLMAYQTITVNLSKPVSATQSAH